MGARNILVEGVSGTGKTSVCHELRRRGFHAVNGDTDLAYQGDPVTGERTTGPPSHWHHLWSVERVRALVEDRTESLTFFCGGSRNRDTFIDLFDVVVLLRVDVDTLVRRLDARPDEFGASPSERALVMRLHHTGEDDPAGAKEVDATAPLTDVVDEVVRLASR